MQQSNVPIVMRPFGRRSEVRLSAVGFGGHHLGDAPDRQTAVRLVRQAVDHGINFFDNCWEYHRGKSEEWMGHGLQGLRDRVFLMTKVCTHGRGKELAMSMLEESLRRLQTDHVDLWQVHGVSFENDPDLFIRPNGAAEALRLAKEQGKVRFVGFTGHKSPDVHLKMLATGFPFDSVQMPLNAFDAHFFSFQERVLPEVNRCGMAALGMKPINGHAVPVNQGILTAEEALRYAMSLPVTVTITGIDNEQVLEQAVEIARGFQPLRPEEMAELRDRVRPLSADGRFEPYKTSLKFDNPEARIAHGFPLDLQSVEVQEILGASENTGRPYPKFQAPQPKGQ
jgi:uncharacterized protein